MRRTDGRGTRGDSRHFNVLPSPPFLFIFGEQKWTAGPKPRSSLHSSSLPLSSAVPLLFISPPLRSLPPSPFMLLLIMALTSLPPSLQQLLPYWRWPSPPCLSLDGTWEVEGRGGVPDGETLNSKREGKHGRMKELESPGVQNKKWERPKRS